jgi:hypothetical protein
MVRSNKRMWLAAINILGFLGTIAVNALAVMLPLNNKTTVQLSDQYPNLFVPSGLTFSIWGVIYVLLAIYCLYQLRPSIRNDATKGAFIENIGWLFLASCILNMAWIFAWQYEYVALSVAVMLLLLATLIAIYLKLRIGYSNASRGEKYLVHVPFSLYLGWISVATIANITALLVYLKWDAFGLNTQFWTVAVITVAIILALVMLVQRRDILYALVVDWALLGILLKRLSESGINAPYVIAASITGLVLVSAGVILRLATRKVY